VERVLESDDMFLAVVERGQLERIFIGFGSRVDQEKRIVVIAGSLAEFVGQFLLQLFFTELE
jgi:hypothetical protein